MKKLFILIWILINACSGPAFAQCPIGGKPANHDDSMKNRSAIGVAYAPISFASLLKIGKNDTVPAGYYTITGYCVLVKEGGAETCNCKTTDKTKWDTHIEISQDSKHTKGTDVVIVEVNQYV